MRPTNLCSLRTDRERQPWRAREEGIVPNRLLRFLDGERRQGRGAFQHVWRPKWGQTTKVWNRTISRSVRYIRHATSRSSKGRAKRVKDVRKTVRSANRRKQTESTRHTSS